MSDEPKIPESKGTSALRDIERSLLALKKTYRPPDLAFTHIPSLYDQFATTADIFRQNHISRALEEQRRFADTIAAQVRSGSRGSRGQSLTFDTSPDSDAHRTATTVKYSR